MNKSETYQNLFKIVVSTEEELRQLYQLFAKEFMHYKEISDFWKSMAKDEFLHIKELENIYKSLSENQLNETVDNTVIENARKNLKRIQSAKTTQIQTLNEAYELSHEIENSEVNAVFLFIMHECCPSKKQVIFVEKEITIHLEKLNNFTKNFGYGENIKTDNITNS